MKQDSCFKFNLLFNTQQYQIQVKFPGNFEIKKEVTLFPKNILRNFTLTLYNATQTQFYFDSTYDNTCQTTHIRSRKYI